MHRIILSDGKQAPLATSIKITTVINHQRRDEDRHQLARRIEDHSHLTLVYRSFSAASESEGRSAVVLGHKCRNDTVSKNLDPLSRFVAQTTAWRLGFPRDTPDWPSPQKSLLWRRCHSSAAAFNVTRSPARISFLSLQSAAENSFPPAAIRNRWQTRIGGVANSTTWNKLRGDIGRLKKR